MAETKSRLFKRETCTRHLLDLLKIAEEINSGNIDRNEIEKELLCSFKVKSITVFGSYINTKNPKIHDLDISIEIVDNPDTVNNEDLFEKRMRLASILKPQFSYFDTMFYQHNFILMTLKHRSNIISLHEPSELAQLDCEKVVVFEDGKVLADILNRIIQT